MDAERVRTLRIAVVAAYVLAAVLCVVLWLRASRTETLERDVRDAAARLDTWREALADVRRARPLLSGQARPQQVEIDHVVRSAAQAGVEVTSMTPRPATVDDPATVQVECKAVPMRKLVEFLAHAERGPTRVVDVWVRRPAVEVYVWNARVVLCAKPKAP